MQSQRYLASSLAAMSSRIWPVTNALRDCKQFRIIGVTTNNLQGFSPMSPCNFLNKHQIVHPFVQQDRFFRLRDIRSHVKGVSYSQKKENKQNIPGSEEPSITSKTNSEQASAENNSSQTSPVVDNTSATEPEKEGILIRFKNTYKRHGKICLAVHLVTSSIWAGSFYLIVVSGLDITKVLEWVGFSQTIIDKMNSPSFGYLATTYLLYKLFTPLRYMVTVAGTGWVVKYLQKSGRMPTTPEANKITSLLKEGGVNIPKSKRRRNKNSKP